MPGCRLLLTPFGRLCGFALGVVAALVAAGRLRVGFFGLAVGIARVGRVMLLGLLVALAAVACRGYAGFFGAAVVPCGRRIRFFGTAVMRGLCIGFGIALVAMARILFGRFGCAVAARRVAVSGSLHICGRIAAHF